ncbi:MAG TPA: hypothetical protein VIT91_01285 [Chthoniobacterales bacterium]
MSTLAEIEEAILKLPPAEFRALLQRMKERDADAWDRQIEEDARSGKLDHLWEEAQREIAEGDVVPLDEFLRNG